MKLTKEQIQELKENVCQFIGTSVEADDGWWEYSLYQCKDTWQPDSITNAMEDVDEMEYERVSCIVADIVNSIAQDVFSVLEKHPTEFLTWIKQFQEK